LIKDSNEREEKVEEQRERFEGLQRTVHAYGVMLDDCMGLITQLRTRVGELEVNQVLMQERMAVREVPVVDLTEESEDEEEEVVGGPIVMVAEDEEYQGENVVPIPIMVEIEDDVTLVAESPEA
jgi:predicted nuclease with TOPRIM domain